MLQRVEEVGLASAMRASAIRVVDPAGMPDQPYTPNPVRSSLIGGIVSGFAGICLALFRARIDRSLQGPGEAPVHLLVRELGVIPAARFHPMRSLFHNRRLSAQRRSQVSIIDVAPAKDSRRDKLELAAWNHSSSLLAESFSATMNSLLFAGQNGWPVDVIILTSADAGDGKTTVSSNLAISLAQVKERVLLVDWDLRHPRLHEVFGVEQGHGLTDLLANDSAIEDLPQESFIRCTLVPGLFLLTAGDASRFAPRLLHSKRAARLVNRLRKDFSTVVIDSPPVLQFSDARVVGKLSDGVLLVLRSGKTTRDAAMAAEQCFLNDGTPLLGTILNDWNPRKSSKYGNYQHYYGRNREGL
jgi:capsular exopolysaccharide synthesis family protein